METPEISTIKKLIQVNLDAADGLSTAADTINDSMMESFLSRCARVRRKYARVLSMSLASEGAVQIGEHLETNIRGIWDQLKYATYKFYPVAILHECRQAEEYALKVYDDALASNLPQSIREQITMQKIALKERYREITQMTVQMEHLSPKL